MNVLIVEDNPISAKVLEHTLDKHGYETITAHDGDQAMQYLESYPDIDLVITDIVMPKTDGIELVRRIKQRPEWSEIPILVCTSQKIASIETRVPDPGWKFLYKPIRADSLILKVREAFAQRRPVLQNPDQTMSQIGVDSESFLEILDEFLKVVNDKITLLEQQLKAPSDDLLNLHDLIEGATLLRAERITDVLSRLNQRAVRSNPELARSIYPSLLRELKAMQHYLTVHAS